MLMIQSGNPLHIDGRRNELLIEDGNSRKLQQIGKMMSDPSIKSRVYCGPYAGGRRKET
jgi:hypothetical protein